MASIPSRNLPTCKAGTERLAPRVWVWISALVAASQVGGVPGCARPQGELFPALETPRRWPPAPEPARIRLVGILRDSRDLKPARSGLEVFQAALRGPRPPIPLSSPHGVAVNGSGVVAVADAAAGAVHLIDLQRRTHRFITGFLQERFNTPIGVCWLGRRLFVTDAGRGEIVELDGQGKCQQHFGGSTLSRPVGIACCAPRESLYVVDSHAHRLVVFDAAGHVIQTIGTRGGGPGEFNFPTHVACRDDALLVADSGNFRVQLLDLDGTWKRSIGQKGDAAGDLSLPKGVTFDTDGHIYVVDAHFENVQIFDGRGRLLMAFGQEGSGLGEFSLPAGIAIDGLNRIWVTDSGNRRLQVFEYLGSPS